MKNRLINIGEANDSFDRSIGTLILMEELFIPLAMVIVVIALGVGTGLNQTTQFWSNIGATHYIVAGVSLFILIELCFFIFAKDSRADYNGRTLGFGAVILLKFYATLWALCIGSILFILIGFGYMILQVFRDYFAGMLGTLGAIAAVIIWLLINYLLVNVGGKNE